MIRHDVALSRNKEPSPKYYMTLRVLVLCPLHSATCFFKLFHYSVSLSRSCDRLIALALIQRGRIPNFNDPNEYIILLTLIVFYMMWYCLIHIDVVMMCIISTHWYYQGCNIVLSTLILWRMWRPQHSSVFISSINLRSLHLQNC